MSPILIVSCARAVAPAATITAANATTPTIVLPKPLVFMALSPALAALPRCRRQRAYRPPEPHRRRDHELGDRLLSRSLSCRATRPSKSRLLRLPIIEDAARAV